MPVKSLENAKRILLATVLTGLCWALPGCQSISPTTNYAEIRFIDASIDAPGLDIYEGNTVAIYNMGPGIVTSYTPISPGTYRFTAKTSGTSQVLVTTTGGVSTGHQYSVLISNDMTANLQETILTDQSQSAPSGQISVRVINEASQSGPYDIYLVPSGTMLIDTKIFLAGSSFTNIGSYINIPTGSYSVVIVPAGTVLLSTTIATYASPVMDFNAGSAHTFLLMDQQVVTTPAAQVVITDDYESPGSVAGP
jgi:hypothetical protein